MTETQTTAPARWNRLVWPGMIFVIIGLHIAIMLVMVYVATSDRSFAIEPDYYQKGLHWDEIAKQRQVNAQLGWKVAIEVAPAADVYGQRVVTCKLTDRDGAPVEQAAVDVVAFAHARASERVLAALTTKGGGIYEGKVRLTRKGLWEFRLFVQRGGDTFTHAEQQQVGAAR